MTRLLSIIASLILISAHGVAAQRKQTPAPGTADEIAIYQLVIDSVFTGRITQAIVVADTAMSLAIPADSVYHVEAARRHALVDIRSYSHSYTTPHSGFVAHLERGADGEWKIVHWRLLWVR